MARIRTYSELRRLETFEERFEYLRLDGHTGYSTFGFDRWLNQQFYRSRMWKQIRNAVIVRDNGCDLGVEGFDIHVGLVVHHMNPMEPGDIKRGELWILDPNYLISTSMRTHNAIHFGDESLLPRSPIERRAGDTRLW